MDTTATVESSLLKLIAWALLNDCMPFCEHTSRTDVTCTQQTASGSSCSSNISCCCATANSEKVNQWQKWVCTCSPSSLTKKLKQVCQQDGNPTIQCPQFRLPTKTLKRTQAAAVTPWCRQHDSTWAKVHQNGRRPAPIVKQACKVSHCHTSIFFRRWEIRNRTNKETHHKLSISTTPQYGVIKNTHRSFYCSGPLRSLTFWRYTNQIIIIIIKLEKQNTSTVVPVLLSC